MNPPGLLRQAPTPRAWDSRVKSAFWKNLIQYGIAAALLAYIISINWEGKPGPGLGDVFAKPFHIGPLILAALIWTVSLLITFVRWWLLVRAQGLQFSLYNALRLGLVSYFFNTFLPGSVGGDILKAVAVARGQSRRTVAVATVIIDRIIGLWALAWLVALLGSIFWVTNNPYLLNNEALKTIVRATAAIVIGSAFAWSLLGLQTEERAERIATRLGRIPKVGHSLGEIWRACSLYRRQSTVVAIALGMTLVAHTGWVVIFYLCVSAFPDIDLPTLAEHFLIVPVGMTAQALFPLPGGIGGGEYAYGWLYTKLDKAATGGILGCLVQRVIAWGIGLIGYIIYTRMKKELPAEAVATLEPATASANGPAES
jgi:glycosyltransferase 2 family protein